MPVCAVITCRNTSDTHNLTHGGVSYHRFPRNPDIKEKWILATGKKNWIPSKVATICSDHFEPDHYYLAKTGERRYLNSYAVPSRNVDSSHNVQLTTVSSSLSVDPATSSTPYTGFCPLLYTSLSQSTPLTTNHGLNPSESDDDVTSIEVEIMPENKIILRPRDTRSLLNPMNINSLKREDKRLMESMRAKIQEQDLLIRKLKVRNYRLKKRLFSLKSMEGMET